jgi:hypothetical protein
MKSKRRHAHPEHLWSTQGKPVPIMYVLVPRYHGVPCIFLIVLLSYAAVGLRHDHGEKRVHSLKLATSLLNSRMPMRGDFEISGELKSEIKGVA